MRPMKKAGGFFSTENQRLERVNGSAKEASTETHFRALIFKHQQAISIGPTTFEIAEDSVMDQETYYFFGLACENHDATSF